MDADKKYITQISQKDLKEIAEVANITAGPGIIITKSDQGLKLDIDKQMFRMWRASAEI